MRAWSHPFVAILAITAIAAASCYAPKLAHAARHYAAMQAAAIDQDPAASTPCREHGALDHAKGDGDTDSHCCAAACGATAFIFGSPALDVLPAADPAFATLTVVLRSMPAPAIDPPPRTL